MPRTLKQASKIVDIAKMARMMREKRGRLGYRPCSKQIGIGFMTYKRIEQGGRLPDMHNFFKICLWLEAHPSDFTFGVFDGQKSP